MYRLVGLVVKASASKASDPRFDSRLRRGDFSGLSHISDFKIGTPVATLPGAWRYRVSAGNGWHGVSILWLGEAEFDLQLLSQCGSTYNCLGRSEIHWHVAGTLSNQPTKKLQYVAFYVLLLGFSPDTPFLPCVFRLMISVNEHTKNKCGFNPAQINRRHRSDHR